MVTVAALAGRVEPMVMVVVLGVGLLAISVVGPMVTEAVEG
jgi:hypothetical protein